MIVNVKATPIVTSKGDGTGVKFTVLLTTGQSVSTEVMWHHSIFDENTPDKISRRIATEVVKGFNSINDDIDTTLTRN